MSFIIIQDSENLPALLIRQQLLLGSYLGISPDTWVALAWLRTEDRDYLVTESGDRLATEPEHSSLRLRNSFMAIKRDLTSIPPTIWTEVGEGIWTEAGQDIITESGGSAFSY